MRVSVVIPAYNEEGWVGRTVRAARNIPDVCELLVIDDGSCDHTPQEARAAGAEVVRLPANRGKGAALQKGVEMSRGEVVVFLDADLCESAGEARLLIEPVAGGAADMAIAMFRPTNHKGGIGLVKRVAALGTWLYTGWLPLEPLSGQRAVRRSVLEEIGFLSTGFGVEVGLTIDAIRRGFRVIEVETAMTHRLTGRRASDFLHRGRQFVDVLSVLASRWGGVGR